MSDIELVKKSLLRKSEQPDYINYGKLPPQARELEEAVLAAILLESACMMDVGRILKPDMFYVDSHQRIYTACVQLFVENNPIDLLTVVDKLKQNGDLDASGGPFFIAQLSNKIGSAANVEYHAMVVKECWIKRKTISISSEAIQNAFEDTTDCHEVLDKLLTHSSNLMTDSTQQEARMWAEVLDDKIMAIKEAASKSEDEKYVIGKPTGLYTLDRKSLGYKDTNLILLAGRPAEGKSTLMVQGAHINVKKKIPVGIFSLEMSADELMDKFLSAETDIDSSRIQNGALKEGEWEKIGKARERMLDWPVYINDVGGITINEIEAISKAWRAKHKIEMLFVDYIQLVEVHKEKGTYSNREQELSQISRKLKKLAKNLGIPVIALAALSREMDKRPVNDRRPKLTDLRESGSLEQDANMVVFIFRPEEHGISNFADQSSTKGVTEFIIAKNRMGPKGIARAKFLGASNKFDDSEYSNFNQEYTDHHETKPVPRTGKLFSESEKEQESSIPDSDTPF